MALSKKDLYRAAQRYAPGPTKSWFARAGEAVSHLQFHRLGRRCFGARWKPVDPGPPGPAAIIVRTAVLRASEIETTTTASYYFASAYSQTVSYFHNLRRNGCDFTKLRDVLEIGCGSGRLIRHWRCIDGARLVGSDIEEASISWCRENLPGIAFHVNDVRPPLTFVADNSFDVVYASSVFTHIDVAIQADWLAEARRVLRPGGFLIADVHGEGRRRQVLSPEQEATVQAEGRLVIYPGEPGSSVSTDVIGSCDAFQTEAEAKRAFGTYFEICDYIPGILDLIVARKTP